MPAPGGPTHVERLRGGFADPLAHFAGDVGASLYMWPGSQDSLQHAEGVGLGAAHHAALARDQRVDEAVVVLRPQLAYASARKAALTHRHVKCSLFEVVFLFSLPPRYRALATGAPAPLRALKSPSPTCRRTECFTPGDAPSQTEQPGMLGLHE